MERFKACVNSLLNKTFTIQHSKSKIQNGMTLVNTIYFRYTNMTQPIPPITLPPSENPQLEGEWLQKRLLSWLDTEFLPEVVNQKIAQRAAQIFVRQRMEGENDLGSLVIAIVTEMQSFDFSKSFYGEFAIANAVSDLLLDSLGFDRCCGQ
jgi:hypothetical protein